MLQSLSGDFSGQRESCTDISVLSTMIYKNPRYIGNVEDGKSSRPPNNTRARKHRPSADDITFAFTPQSRGLSQSRASLGQNIQSLLRIKVQRLQHIFSTSLHVQISHGQPSSSTVRGAHIQRLRHTKPSRNYPDPGQARRARGTRPYCVCWLSRATNQPRQRTCCLRSPCHCAQHNLRRPKCAPDH
jgi:hypothetical protein